MACSSVKVLMLRTASKEDNQSVGNTTGKDVCEDLGSTQAVKRGTYL